MKVEWVLDREHGVITDPMSFDIIYNNIWSIEIGEVELSLVQHVVVGGNNLSRYQSGGVDFIKSVIDVLHENNISWNDTKVVIDRIGNRNNFGNPIKYKLYEYAKEVWDQK